MPTFRTSTPGFRIGSTLPQESNGSVLPKIVHDYLAGGATEGSRNDTLHRCAQQFFAAGLDQAEAESRLLPRALEDGLSESEARQAINSGYRSTVVTQPLKAHQNYIRPVQKTEISMHAALKAAFKPGERIAICPAHFDGDKWAPGRAVIHTLEGWLKRLPASLEASDGGCYIGINPLREGAQRRLRDDVAVFRHVLVEWEGIEPAEQERKLRDSGLPISVMTTSGGRSVHGWVRVDAPDLPTWEKRRDLIFDRLKCDPKNKDVSRVSRLPGFMRGNQEQKLLATNIGAKSWDEWESSGLPGIITLGDLIQAAPAPPPEIIKGVLYQSTKMMIGAPSKARKSWVLLDLALSVSTGVPWLGFDTTQGKVLMLNFELKPFMIHSRVASLCKGKQYGNPAAALQNFHLWNLRGHANDLGVMIPQIIQRIKTGGYTLLILDPIYKGLGARDENHAGDINELLTQLERLAAETGAAILYTHHFAKGNAGEKHAIDRASGSGVWARDPDTLMMLTPPSTPKKGEEKPKWDYEVEIVARAHPRIEPFHVTWQGAHYERDGHRNYVLKPRDGGMASEYGDAVAAMPRLKRNRNNNASCPILAWLHEKLGLGLDGCEKVFDHLRQPRYTFLKSEGEGVWVGSRYAENSPF